MPSFFMNQKIKTSELHQKIEILNRGGCVLQVVDELPEDLGAYRGMYLLRNNEQLIYVNAKAQCEEISLARCNVVRLAYINFDLIRSLKHSRFFLVFAEEENRFMLIDNLMGPRSHIFIDENIATLRESISKMELNIPRELTSEEEQSIGDSFNTPSFLECLATIREATQQKGSLIVLNENQRRLLHLIHPHLNVCAQDAIRKDIFPQSYNYERYPTPLRQLSYFIDTMMNFAVDVIETAKNLVQFIVNFLTFLPRTFESFLLQHATKLQASVTDDANISYTDFYRPMKRLLLARDEVMNSDVLISYDKKSNKDAINNAMNTRHLGNPNAFAHYIYKYAFLPVGFKINSEHANVVVNSLYKAWSQENLSAKERLMQAVFFISVLPITLPHVTVGLAFEAMDWAVILLRASVSACVNMPVSLFDSLSPQSTEEPDSNSSSLLGSL